MLASIASADDAISGRPSTAANTCSAARLTATPERPTAAKRSTRVPRRGMPPPPPPSRTLIDVLPPGVTLWRERWRGIPPREQLARRGGPHVTPSRRAARAGRLHRRRADDREDDLEQAVEIERLVQVRDHLRAPRRVRSRAHRDDRHVLVGLVLAHRAEELLAAERRHPEIEQDERRRRPRTKLVEPVPPVDRGVHREPRVPERAAQRLADDGVVLDDQDPPGRGHHTRDS